MKELSKKIISSVFTRELNRFKGIHEGESCYIFGDGPSIKWFNLKNFNDKPSICCGMIPFHRDFFELNVQYITLVEPWFFLPSCAPKKSDVKHTRGIQIRYLEMIKKNPEREFFINLTNFPVLRGSNINYVLRTLPGESNLFEKLGSEFNPFQGSFHSVLTLAYYMGFKEVYLVGFDAWTIQPSRTMRWYEKGGGAYLETKNFAIDFLNVLKQTMEIYTISVDGASKNTKNIPYLTYTGSAPKFQENYQLLEEEYLKALASYSGYKIF